MTFSIVVAVPASRLLAAATASRSLGVGNSVPAVWPGVGAVVSQAWTNRSLRGRALALLNTGSTPGGVLAEVPTLDAGHAHRQLALVDARGRVATYTGGACSVWAGACSTSSRDGGVSGAICANLVAGGSVVEAMADEVADSGRVDDAGELARLLVRVLHAGQRAGGDVRGQQSAAVQVGAGNAQDWQPPDLAVDLRVDDHCQPLTELDRLIDTLTPRTA
ncbi:DUF1028 domain-containing protein [Solicola gregarius]|uniref:DUF1028 domain-containing protein n=1 Tax=Solicola gregarius TaxID=2908642 RepID=A0AA46TLK3_9ACTN|nr:DUF1028 domain-containing protein [Solicola gregarius]UYM06668.1 DUF1028 domain-containing protein [Solicola gregarius]